MAKTETDGKKDVLSINYSRLITAVKPETELSGMRQAEFIQENKKLCSKR